MRTIRWRCCAVVLLGLGLIAGDVGCGSVTNAGADGAAGTGGTGVGGSAPGMGGAIGGTGGVGTGDAGTGGAATGGAGTGGAAATGGAGTGGAGTGGAGTGGAGTGGVGTGGVGTGGAGTGGAGTGGVGTGGAGTGGAGTGGAGTGGGGTGGAPSCPSRQRWSGTACVPYSSCRELHAAEPALASGSTSISPSGNAADAFTAYCDMTTAGGGWTLVLNAGPSFDRQATGIATDTCYASNCTNRAYSTAPIKADLMIDAANQNIVAEGYAVRVVITGVHPATAGKTVRQLFVGPGPFFAEKEDNSNVQLIFPNAGSCATLPQDFAAMVCDTFVMTFSDPGWDTTACSEGGTTLTVGGSTNYTDIWYNCAAWPENPNHMGFDFYPDNMRFWVR